MCGVWTGRTLVGSNLGSTTAVRVKQARYTGLTLRPIASFPCPVQVLPLADECQCTFRKWLILYARLALLPLSSHTINALFQGPGCALPQTTG